MASTDVSSALFTAVSLSGSSGGNPQTIRPYRGGAPENPHKTSVIMGYPLEIRKISSFSGGQPPEEFPDAKLEVVARNSVGRPRRADNSSLEATVSLASGHSSGSWRL